MSELNRLVVPQGKNQTYEEERSKLLSQLAIILLFVTTFYFVLKNIYDVVLTNWIFSLMYLCGTGIYLLNHFKRFTAAKLFGLTLFNILLYCIASSEIIETGIFLFFGTAATTAIVIFDYTQRWIGYAFAIFSALLFGSTQLWHYSPLNYREFTPDQIQLFFIINVGAFTYTTLHILNLLIRSNYWSEKNLNDKRLELIQRNEDLKKTNSELDRFVYSISHDIRAPLSSVSGLIKLTDASSDLSEIKRCIGMMKDRVDDLDRFVQEVTDYYENIKTDTTAENFQVKPLIAEIIDSLKFQEGAGTIVYINEVPDQSCIRSDRVRLRIAIRNIISNGIKYRDTTKDNPFVRVNFTDQAGKCMLSIEDNGEGINDEYQAKVFNMFYRASKGSTGSGLGLYIARETIHKLNGTISLHSNKGIGTKLIIEFPTDS